LEGLVPGDFDDCSAVLFWQPDHEGRSSKGDKFAVHHDACRHKNISRYNPVNSG